MKLKIFHDKCRGMTWAVRIVEEGDEYGLNSCLINDGEDLVEFYDCRCENDTNLGQFVSRYYKSTLLHPNRNRTVGLNLQGDVPAWSINVECYLRILKWLEAQ